MGVPLVHSVVSPPEETAPRADTLGVARRPSGSTASGLGPVVRRRARRRRLGWIGLIAALVAVAGFLVSRRFYYGNDDLLEFTGARQDGLSWQYLSSIVWQHFAPFNRFAHWVVLTYSDMAPALGLSLVLVNYALVLGSSLWLMTELRLSTARRAAALIAIGLSAGMTESAIWFDPGMHILAAITVTLAVCAAHLRGVRTRRRRWHVVALVLFVLGQATQERPAFALPLIVLVDVLLLWRALPWGERLRRLWQLRAPLASLTLAAAGIAAALRLYVTDPSLGTPSWSVTGRTMLMALTNYTVPSLANQPLAEPSGDHARFLILAGILVAGVALARARSHNAGPLLFSAAVFLLYYSFLKFSPLLSTGTIAGNAERLHNAVYVTIPTVIALAHLRLPKIGRRRGRHHGPPAHRPGPPSARRHGLLVTGCCLALAGYLAASNEAYLARQWPGAREARAYLDAVRADAQVWSDPATSLVPLYGPASMAGGWSQPLSRHDKLLPLIDGDAVPGSVGGRPALIDDRGRTRPAALQTVLPDVDVVGGNCSSGRTTDSLRLEFPVVRGQPLLVRLDFVATRDLDLYLTAGWDRDWTSQWRSFHLPAGAHSRLVPIDAKEVGALELDVLTRGARMCVRVADIVRALVVEDGGATCRTVDWYGRPRTTVPCP
jgi:hypothetical protein